jgi:hypothetical protein
MVVYYGVAVEIQYTIVQPVKQKELHPLLPHKTYPKPNMLLPDKIDIQLVDTTGNQNLLENVLFGLKIYITEHSWYNYSFCKTNAAGHITLTKQDIIDYKAAVVFHKSLLLCHFNNQN